MTVATATRPTVQTAPATDLPLQLRSLETELNMIFLERRDAIRALLIALLSKQNGFILGPPGTGKSELLETLCKAFIDAKYFRILLDKMMGKEDIAGAISVPDYVQKGDWHRDVTDTLMDAHLALLDEVGNTGPMIMNLMLTALNERRNKPNGVWQDIPLISAFGASNFELEDSPASWDRFLIRFKVEDIQDDANFEILFGRKCGTLVTPQVTTLINLADLQHAIAHEVPKVIVPTGVQEAVRSLRADLRAEGITVSTRRNLQFARTIQASAYLDGRMTADEDDLLIGQHILWEQFTDQKTVQRTVLAYGSPIRKLAGELATQLDSISAEVDSRSGQKSSIEDRAAYGGTAHHEINEIQTKLTKAVEDANREGRNTSMFDPVSDQIRSVRAKVYVQCMNVTPERAAMMS